MSVIVILPGESIYSSPLEIKQSMINNPLCTEGD